MDDDDELLSSDSRYRQFKDEAAACLLQFERAQEWADLIRYLLRLQKILGRYDTLPIIPDKVLFAKRLYQCLNPALPSGVHEKTLETIELIFARIGPNRLARGAWRTHAHARASAHSEHHVSSASCCAHSWRRSVRSRSPPVLGPSQTSPSTRRASSRCTGTRRTR